MAKKFSVYREFTVKEAIDSPLNNESYTVGDLLDVRKDHGVDYIYDGCFKLAKADDKVILAHGRIVDSLF